LRPTATHTYQIEENDTKVSTLLNTTAFPFSDLPCFYTVESKNSQQPTEKKQAFLKNPKTTFCSDSKP